MEFLLFTFYVLLLLFFAGYNIAYVLDDKKIYIEKIILYGFAVIGAVSLFFSTCKLSVLNSYLYIWLFLILINVGLFLKFKIKLVKVENTFYEILFMLFMLILIAYPLVYFGLEFHSFYNFDFYFYSVLSNWLLDHDITTRILDGQTIMDSVISSSMRETMVTRIFTEFFTAFTSVIPSKFGYETRNLFMVNHTIFAVILPIMVLRVLSLRNNSKIVLLLLLVSVNALLHFGYFYQLFPQTVGMVLSLWIILEFKQFLIDEKKIKLTLAILVLFVTYPEITPVVLFPLVISFFAIKGLNKATLVNLIKILALFLTLGFLTTNYYFVDMFKFLIEQIFHGFQSNIQKGEILFPYYLNYSGFISLFGLLTTPNDFSLFMLKVVNENILYGFLSVYSLVLYLIVILGLKQFYKENPVVFSAFLMYTFLFILFFSVNKDFSTFKIAFLIQPYLIIALLYGLQKIDKQLILYLLIAPYIIFNLITSLRYSYMSISDDGIMREVKGNMVSDGGEFAKIQNELKNEKYNAKVFSTTVNNLALEHWLSYFLKGKEQAIPLIGKQLGSGKYVTTGYETLKVDNLDKKSVDYFITEVQKSNVVNSFYSMNESEYKSNAFSIVSTKNIKNFIIPNRLTSPYLMEASMYKEDLLNFPWYLFKDTTPYGDIGHLSRSSDFYIINPSSEKTKLVLSYSGYYTHNEIKNLKLTNTISKEVLYASDANRAFSRVIIDNIVPSNNQQFTYVADFIPNTQRKSQTLSSFLNQSTPHMRDIVISLYQFSFIDKSVLDQYKAPSVITTKEMLTNTLLPITGIYEDGWAVKEINTELNYSMTSHKNFYLNCILPKHFKEQEAQIFIGHQLLKTVSLKAGENMIVLPLDEMKDSTYPIRILFDTMNIISRDDQRYSSVFIKSFGFN